MLWRGIEGGFVCHLLRLLSYHLDKGKKTAKRLLVNIEKSEILLSSFLTAPQHKWKGKNSRELVIYTLHLFKLSVSRLQQFGPNLFVI